MVKTILVVEDDAELQQAMQETLNNSGYRCVCASNISEAEKALQSNEVSLIISDVQLQASNGIEAINIYKNLSKANIVYITAFSNIKDSVNAIKLGASDYIVKPFVPSKLLDLVDRYALSSENVAGFIAKSDSIKKTLITLEKAAKTKITILLEGESGTGKEVLAKYIHKNSRFSEGPFVAINCAAIPENMLEATMFGYEKGAYTGASKSMPGKFEQAQNGTIFLDEVSEIPFSLQAKILRVLQEKEVERLSSTKTIKLNLRIIAATNLDLRKLVHDRKFRADLYFRLGVFPIKIPPLRERVADILPIAKNVIANVASKNNLEKPELSDVAAQLLEKTSWLGNIRQLENVITRAVIICNNNVIESKDLMLDLTDSVVDELGADNIEQKDKIGHLKKQEFDAILKALEEYEGCKKKVAEYLGISDRTLRNKITKMKGFGVVLPDSYANKRGQNVNN